MLLRSHSQEGHGVGCQCGCSSKVIHYPQVAKTVAPTLESGASEALNELKQLLEGQNCSSARFYDAEGVGSRVGGQKHAQGDYNGFGISTPDSLDNLYANKALGKNSPLEGHQFAKVLAQEEKFNAFLESRRYWKEYGEETKNAMIAVGADFKQINKVDVCGLWQIWSRGKDTGITRLEAVNRCKNHFLCFGCANIRARKMSHEVAMRIDAYLRMNPQLAMSMLTLTAAHVGGLRKQLRRIKRALKKLLAKRRSQRSKKNESIEDVLAQIEAFTKSIEVAKGDNGWHPHVHMLIFHEKFLRMPELERIWAKCLGQWGRAVINVKNVLKPYEYADADDAKRKDFYGAIMECSKYVCKPDALSPTEKVAVWRECKGWHMFAFGGGLRGLKPSEALCPPEQARVDEDYDYYVARYDRESDKYEVEHIGDLSDSKRAEVRRVFKYGWIPPRLAEKPIKRKIEAITVFRGGNVEKIHRPIAKVGIVECRQ